MAASWPSAKKTFSAVVDGITKLVALLFNAGYDEIEAMQTWLGAPNNAQTKLAALNRLFKYLNPVISVTWIDDDTVEIAATALAMFNGNDYVIKENTVAIQIKVSVDLDTGSEAANTWYDVFLVGDGASSTFTAKFVVQGNTPSGATYYKKIFAVKNDGSSNILKFFHRIKRVMLDVPILITTTVSAGAWSAALSCAAAIPSISTFGIFGLHTQDAGGDCLIALRPNGSTWITPTNAGNTNSAVSIASSGVRVAGQRMCATDDSQQIQYYNGGGDNQAAIYVEGYEINIQ